MKRTIKPDTGPVGPRSTPDPHHPAQIQDKGVRMHLSGAAVPVPIHSGENASAQTNNDLPNATQPIQRSDKDIKSKEYPAF